MKKSSRFLGSMVVMMLVAGAVPAMQVHASGNIEAAGKNFSNNQLLSKLSMTGSVLNIRNTAGTAGSPGTTSPDGGNSGTDSNANKSPDNSLSSLVISPGSLSPAFQYSTTSYTATVGDDVTEIAVDAKVSNPKATVESITGNTNLQPGTNTINVLVKAENGAAVTYKIVVKKGGQGTTQKPADTPADTPANEDVNKGTITLNGNAYSLSPTIAADVIPAGFTKTTITYNGAEAEGLKLDKGELVLAYLTTPDKDVKNTLAVYDQGAGSFSTFMKIDLGDNYVILLNPPADPGLPAGYAAATVEVGTFGAVNAFANSSEFYLIYAISNQGIAGWYQYDSKEATFQRYVQNAAPEVEEEQNNVDTDIKNLQTAYDKLDKQYQDEKGFARKTIAVLIFLAAVLIVVIINLLIRAKKDNKDDWEDDFESVPRRFQKKEKETDEPEVKKAKKPVEKPEVKKEKKPDIKPDIKPEEPVKEEVKKADLNKPLEKEDDDFEVIDLDDL